MPYYVYHVGPLGVLKKLSEFAAFREASLCAKAERNARAQAAGGGGSVKVMFADNEGQAEDLLSQVREAGPMTGDDD